MGQKTIYVKDEVKWGEVKDAAEKLGMGIGEYLLGREQKVASPSMIELSLDRIEAKIDELLNPKMRREVAAHAEAQAKLDKIRSKSDKHKKDNPFEICDNCKKANQYCMC